MIVLPLERTQVIFSENKCIYLFVCLNFFEGIQIFETKKAKKISTCYNMKILACLRYYVCLMQKYECLIPLKPHLISWVLSTKRYHICKVF